MIPGMNLLALALTVIGSAPVNYFQYSGRVTNAAGFDLTTYADPVCITVGSVQAVDRSMYAYLGLDLEKSYICWYVPDLDATDLARDVSGDVIEYAGKRYQLSGGTDWFNQDGWKSFLGVLIGPATGSETNA